MVGRTTFNALAASGQTAATTAVGLAYFGFLMRALGPETLGGWLAWLSLGMIACLADLGLRDALVRRTAIAMASFDRERAGDLLDTTVVTVAATMAVALLLLMGVLPRFFDFGAVARHTDASLIVAVAVMIWLQRVMDVYAAALEGLQRYATVARNNVVAALIGLLTIVVLVPHFGVQAASAGLIVQYGCAGLANLMALRRVYPDRSALPRRWSWALCRQGMGYGLAVQGAVGSFIIIESAIKLTLSRGNALALLAFFDLAFRIGRGLRNLLAAGNRVLVPRLAQAHASTERGDAPSARAASGELESVYLRSFQAMLFLAVPTFALSAASAGLISLLTRGTVDPMLVDMFWLTLPMWFVFAMADPAINLQMATGALRPMLAAHGAMLLLLAAGLLTIGAFGHDRGFVTIAMACAAIVVPCLWLIWWHHRVRALPIAVLEPRRALVGIVAGMAAAWLPSRFPDDLAGQSIGLAAAAVVTLAGLRFLPAWAWAVGIVTRLLGRSMPIGER